MDTLSHVQFGATANTSAVKGLVYVSWCTSMHISVRYKPGNEYRDHRVRLPESLVDNTKWFSKLLPTLKI